MHNDFVRPDGQWPGETVPVPRDLILFDIAQFKSVNADDGGEWHPTSPIVIGGAGITLNGSTHTISGGVLTKNGGRLQLGHNDWPTFVAPQGRRIVVPLVHAHTSNAQAYQLDESLDPSGIKVVESLLTPIQFTIPQRYMHHGARLISAVLTFRVGQPHLAIPAVLPFIQLFRLPQGHASFASTGTATPLPTPVSADTYYANGSIQTITAAISANNTIDVGLYNYLVAIGDEQGAGSLPGNIFSSLTLVYDSIADMRFE